MEGSDKRPHPWGLRGNRELSKRKKWSMRVQLGRGAAKTRHTQGRRHNYTSKHFFNPTWEKDWKENEKTLNTGSLQVMKPVSGLGCFKVT